MANKSKKPTGLSIVRKGDDFTCKWKQGEKYAKQDFDYQIDRSKGTDKWKSKSVTKKDNDYKIKNVSAGSYFGKDDKGPLLEYTYIKSVKFRIRGDSGKKESISEYATKTMKLKAPPSPRISASLVTANKTNFVIEKPYDSEKKPVSGVAYEYVTVTNFNQKKINDKSFPKKGISYGHFTGGSYTLSISTSGSLTSSETTIVRAKTYGMGGRSKWVYSSHTYANPYKPKDLKVVTDSKGNEQYKEDQNSNTTTVNLSWIAPKNRAHPIDETIIQYLIGTPVVNSDYIEHPITTTHDEHARAADYYKLLDKYGTLYYYDESEEAYKLANLDVLFIVDQDEEEGTFHGWLYNELYHSVISLDIPDGANFTDAQTQTDRGYNAEIRNDKTVDTATLVLDTIVGIDQCLWARVAVRHDGDYNRITSDYILVKKGKLATPTITKLETFEDTYKASVTVQNNSQVAGSFVALVYQDNASSLDSGKIIGVVSNGTTQIQCFNWEKTGPITIGAYAVCGSINIKGTTETTYEGLTAPVKVYAIDEVMRSSANYNDGKVPVSPTNVSAVKLPDREGTAQVTWDIPWLEATGAEISWADHDDAWYSTDGPTSYTVESTKKPLLNVTGLETGKIWYFCVRLYKQSETGEVIYGAPSDIVACDLAEAPAIPVLELSESTVPVDKEVKASWVYTSFDHTDQASAKIGEIIEGQSTPKVIDSLNPKTEQFVNFKPSELGWETGSTHQLVVMVCSQGGKESSWSEAEELTIAEPPTCTITSTNLEKQTIDGNTEMALTSLPMRVTIEGSNDSDSISLIIRRYDDYPMDRPDNSEYIGYAGDSIVTKSKESEDYIEITTEDLESVGTQFDDGAKYQLIAIVQDVNGQVAYNINEDGDGYLIPDPEGAEDEDGRLINYEYFTVNWNHQAIEPVASVEMIENDVAKIHIGMPEPPEGSTWELEEGDHVDIYRLSAGKPQLLYPNATFNTDYADPYPTIGKRGGYRIVFVTNNGDYIVKDIDGERPDWLDITENAHIDTKFQYIDFDDSRVIFKFNVKFSNSWKKNFTLTHYLSGKVEGDWLAGTEHTNNISGVTIDDLEDDDIENGTLDELYSLAEYSNRCHIRTIEGFNYCANIEVSDNSEYGHPEHPHDVTLNVTEVPNPQYDGVLWENWIGEE